ncbi:MAG: hypothetical protein ACI4B3_01940 [Prevotella sp.]
MKKIFTLIAFALCAVCANAQTTTTLWEPENSNPVLLQWGSGEVTINNVDVVAGDIITVTVSSVDKTIDSYPQATMCTPYGDDWEWQDLQNVLMPEAGKYEFSITEEMIEKINSHKQIFFKGTAAYISKVELTTGTDPNLLWSGSLEFGSAWAENIVINSLKLANIKVGDAIVVTVSSFSAGNQLLFKNTSYKDLPYSCKGLFGDDQKTATLGITNGNIETVKAGLMIQGVNFTVESIVLVPAEGDVDYSNVIVATDFLLTDSRNGLEVFGPSSIDENIKYLQIEIEGTPSWSQICNSGWTNCDMNKEQIDNVLQFEINDAFKSSISKFIIQGAGFTVKKISLSSSSLTNGINSIEVSNSNNVRYNLAGQRVGNGAKMYIMNGKKYLK